ncbi:hypothetical protein [Croceicoccus bisphenolivorans]|uniref:hypothetical protein n=1 Tax=Croceicoccus bisphenolivorans TaxID=1783232 RepID=UPI00082C3EC5|nr:hypothetical protein [Croceicoccus bisphenolivorans]
MKLPARAIAITLLPAVLLLGGCTHRITRLPHDCAGEGGWCPRSREVARQTWGYAQLAQNAYWQEAEESDDYLDREYLLPPDLKERYATVDDHYGYAYSLFDRFDEKGGLSEVVLVYRGTEGPKDWWHGTLLGRQGPRGLTTYRQVRAGLDEGGYASVPVALAGHSLGGRIADHVLKKLVAEDGALPATLSSYLFNPNASGTALAPAGDWKAPVHVSVSESGEVAAWVRVLTNDKEWDGYVIDCQTTINPVAKHYMRRLADCLTWVAAIDDAGAALSVERNAIGPPPVNRIHPAE